MNYVFGPVPSRRLGRSLGIDTIPLKTCNWNCVYCQLGRSVPLQHERKAYFPSQAILAEVEQFLCQPQPPPLDWITFVGSGEPTLHSEIGWLVRKVKTLSDKPVAVITNGSLLYLPEVRQELSVADAILPSLDAGNPALYRKINRPHPEISFERLVEGLIAFRKEFCGKYWVEVMLVRGLNDTEPALREIATILAQIQPDEVHLLLPDRPPAEKWVKPSDEDGLLRAMAILGERAHVVHPAQSRWTIDPKQNVIEAILGVITRHPLREDDLLKALSEIPSAQVATILSELEKSGQAQVIERYGTRFWCSASSRYPP
ncbi:MAG: Fe-S oxidoreductase [Anaerolineae bacterium]|nr:MAG: Fe-S oxidoreductase [Anaerolineae bacterium]